MRKCACENVQKMHARKPRKMRRKDCGQVPPERLPACMLHRIRLASSRSRQALRPLPEHPMQRASRHRVPCMALCFEANVSPGFEHSKKRWKMVLIYSQHIWFFFVFFWGDVTVSSLFISRPGQTVVTNFIYKMQGDAIHDVIVIFVILL